MKTAMPTIFSRDFVTGAVLFCRRFLRIAVLLAAAGILLAGCGPALKRPEVTQQNLLKLRRTTDEQAVAASDKLLGRLLQRTKAEYDRRLASGQKGAPVIDVLIISGGGDWGAFGAGFLKGWLKVSAQHPLAKPEFDAVTGVSTGALIAVNTTNLDDASARVFDLVEEARRAADAGRLGRLHDIMLASAGIPGAFPFRVIDDELYVDGGITGNIIYGGRVAEDHSLPALWQKAFPGLPLPKMRFWAIFNNQFRPVPQVTAPHRLDLSRRKFLEGRCE